MELLATVLHSEKSIYISVRAGIILLISFLLSGLVAKIAKKKTSGSLHYRFINSILTVLIYVLGLVTAFSQIPSFSKTITTVLAGSGIAALSIGLAAQESLGNLINGLVISFSKPFEVGDRIHLINGNITGYIEDITMRHTVVRTFVNSRIIIPNSLINKDMIENSSFMEDKASGFIDVTISYDSDLELASRLIARIIETHPDFAPPQSANGKSHTVNVYTRALAPYGVELRASMWTSGIGNNFDACSDVRRLIKLAFDENGIRFSESFLAPRT